MNGYSNRKLSPNARALRRNMTREERHLWYDCLKELPIPVKRQKVIENYIVDFYIPRAGIVIELDGSQHFADAGREQDLARDQRLNELGILVLRYSNADVNLRFRAVCDDIWNHLQERSQLPSP